MSELLLDFVEAYLDRLPIPRDTVLTRMEAQAEREGIPVVGPQVGRLLFILARACGARRVLELGTAIGYSALWLAQALPEDGHVLTVERDAGRAEEARRYLARAGARAKVDVREGAALDVVRGLTGPFDLIFNDIDKEGYPDVLPYCVRLLRPGGLLVTDNALFHDTVPRGDDTPAARAIRAYNRMVMEHPGLASVVLPLRDGVAVSLKVGG